MRTVLLIASEGLPFSKTGGLADVIGALPPALARLGWDATVMMPQYRGVTGGRLLARDTITLDGRAYDVAFNEHPLESGARAVLIECPQLYDRDGVYGRATEHPDNPLRFGLLNLAALGFTARFGPCPDVVHAHEWPAGLAPVHLRPGSDLRRRLPTAATVFTLHNLAYQGVFDASWLPRLQVPEEEFAIDRMEFWGQISLLKGGIVHADMVTTVSPSYAAEIQTPAYGCGFDGILRQRSGDLVGILNGIDTTTWDPSHDPFLPQPFSAADVSGKRAAKRALLARYRLPVDERAMARPVVGMISRLVAQKGFDLLTQAGDALIGLDVTYVLLGSGEPQVEAFWKGMAAATPDRVGVHIGFDERLAHLVEAGADAFLMPSRFEPCGLNQMISMRYGTVPIVRAVGGLADSVDATVGFPFHDYSVGALLDVLREATRIYRDEPDRWSSMVARGMRRDHSWDRAAGEYAKVYERAMAKRRLA